MTGNEANFYLDLAADDGIASKSRVHHKHTRDPERCKKPVEHERESTKRNARPTIVESYILYTIEMKFCRVR